MKNFLKQVAACFFGSCFSICVVTALTLFAMTVGVGMFVSALVDAVSEDLGANGAFGEAARDVRPGSVLVVDLSRGFSDAPTFAPANTPGVFSGEKGRYGLLDTIRALETAATDDAVSAVLLLGGDASAWNGFATISELRAAIYRFRETGRKPVFAYLPSPSFREYLLATSADELWLHPFAEIPLNGLSSGGIYLKTALENLGVGVQITRVGTHKSAVEPLISDKMSEEDRAQRRRLIEAEWTLARQALLNGRAGSLVLAGKSGNTKSAADGLARTLDEIVASRGIVPAKLAAEKSLADAALYEDEMIERLREIAGTDETTLSFRQVSLDDYLRSRGIAVPPPLATGNPALDLAANGSVGFTSEPCVAVVYAEGEITDGPGEPGTIGGLAYAQALRELRNDESVRALVLRVNSPGGSVFASERIRREVELFAKKKPLVVSMGDVAASGGYWISTPASKVFADPMTVTGSIGVFGVIFNLENLGKKIGVASDAVVTAPFAELDTVRRPKTPEEMAVFQGETERIYAHFLRLVSEARKMPVEQVDAVAQGQVWIGVHAKELRLVDAYGGLVEALAAAREAAGLSEDAPVISVPGEVNRFQPLFDLFDESSEPVVSAGTAFARKSANPALAALARGIDRIAERLSAFNDPKGIYARLPFDIDDED